jgi:AbrB family looped-hinge helix DNA binding protein
MRITAKGQVTIPIAIREQAGLLPDTEVEFVLERGGVKIIKKKSPKSRSRGQNIVTQMRGKATVKLTTEQIMALTRGEK